MLTISPRALDVIRQVTGHPALSPSSGLRIARRPDPSQLWEVRAVEGPDAGDSVVEFRGARLLLGPGTRQRLENGRLDAFTDAAGRVQFVLSEAG